MYPPACVPSMLLMLSLWLWVALGYLRKEVEEGQRVGSMVWEKIALQLSETFTLKKTRAHLD